MLDPASTLNDSLVPPSNLREKVKENREFIEPLEITVYAVSKGTGIPQTALSEIIKGKRNLSGLS